MQDPLPGPSPSAKTGTPSYEDEASLSADIVGWSSASPPLCRHRAPNFQSSRAAYGTLLYGQIEGCRGIVRLS